MSLNNRLNKLFRIKQINYICLNKLLFSTKVEAKDAINDAVNVIELSKSPFHLKNTFHEENSKIEFYVKGLVQKNHPLLDIIGDTSLSTNISLWGLAVLLLSKTAGVNAYSSSDIYDVKSGLLHSQYSVAEVVEMLRSGYVVHNMIKHCPKRNDAILSENKMALLGGDYLLAKSSNELASIKNQYLNEIVSSGIRDMTECQFLGIRDCHNEPIPSKPLNPQRNVEVCNQYGTKPMDPRGILGYMTSEWTLRNILGGGHLLAKACQGTLKIAGHNQNVQNLGYLIGKHFVLLTQAHIDKELFSDEKSGPFSLVSAPVMMHLEDDPSLYNEIEFGIENVNNVNFDLIRKIIKSGKGIEKTQRLKEIHCDRILNAVGDFEKSDARNALENVVTAVRDM